MANRLQPQGPLHAPRPAVQADTQAALPQVKGHCNNLLPKAALKIPNRFIVPQPPPPTEREEASPVSPVRTRTAVPQRH